PRQARPAVEERRLRSRLPRGPLPRDPPPGALRLPATGRRRRSAAWRLGRAEGRRGGRAQPGEADAARGLLGAGGGAPRRIRLRPRRAPRRRRARPRGWRATRRGRAPRARRFRGPRGECRTVRLVRELLLLPLHLYRRGISPALGPHCRYHPTCSEYAPQAVREY